MEENEKLKSNVYSEENQTLLKDIIKEKIGSTFAFTLTVFYAIVSIIIFLIYFIKTIKREEITALIKKLVLLFNIENLNEKEENEVKIINIFRHFSSQ